MARNICFEKLQKLIKTKNYTTDVWEISCDKSQKVKLLEKNSMVNGKKERLRLRETLCEHGDQMAQLKKKTTTTTTKDRSFATRLPKMAASFCF